jgi:hypothetical protein
MPRTIAADELKPKHVGRWIEVEGVTEGLLAQYQHSVPPPDGFIGTPGPGTRLWISLYRDEEPAEVWVTHNRRVTVNSRDDPTPELHPRTQPMIFRGLTDRIRQVRVPEVDGAGDSTDQTENSRAHPFETTLSRSRADLAAGLLKAFRAEVEGTTIYEERVPVIAVVSRKEVLDWFEGVQTRLLAGWLP